MSAVLDRLIAPETEAELIESVREAAASDQALHIVGNDTKSAMLRPVAATARLTTSRLGGVDFYAPTELAIAAGSGTTLARIESVLAERGQFLAAEPPDLSALFGTAAGAQTLGGIVATNLSGPRRILSGAVRDHVLGVRAVNGSGELIRSGGRVLKNVTGLDLCRLLAGSHGTLAVLSQITMKALPAPEAAATLILPGLDAAAGVTALSAALGSPYGVSGAAWLPALPDAGTGAGVACIRIEDFAESVAYRGDKLRALLAAHGAVEWLDDAATRRLWHGIRDAAPLRAAPAEAVWRVSVRPSRGPSVLAALPDVAHGYLDWGGGLAWIAGPATIAMHAAVMQAARQAGGVWMLLRAPDALRRECDVVPPETPALAAITARVKTAMDPRHILNPGHLFREKR